MTTPATAPRAALFDMDRTLVRVETASLYVRYQREIGEAKLRDSIQVGWWVLLYTFNLLDAPKVASRALTQLEGMWETVLAARCDDWFQAYVAHHVSDAARTTVRRHREQGDLLAIATGASTYASRPLAREMGIEHLLATEFEVVDGRFTGRPLLPLCFGEGKVHRATTLLASRGIELRNTTFYSDSLTDLPLLEAVGHPVVVNPDPRLLRIARRRGWPVERW